MPAPVNALAVARRTFQLRNDPEMGGLAESQLRGVAADQLAQEFLAAEKEAEAMDMDEARLAAEGERDEELHRELGLL